MADFRTKLTLDGSDFNSALNNAGKSVNDFSKQTQGASKQVDDMGKATKKTASELLNEMKNMEGLGRSTSNYRSQLAQLTRDIQDLSINYKAMSNEMKNSDFGREVAAQIQELTNKAADMKDQVQDASSSVKLLASDTANLDAAKSAIEGLSAGMQLFASVGILGEENTEKVVKALAKLKAIESATNAVIKIANILNKDSILMLKIKQMQLNAATRAQELNNASTAKGTIAQKAFNVAAKANPYVLLATAILAVVGAMVLFTDETEEAVEVADDYVSASDKMRKQNESLADSFSRSLGTTIAKYQGLRTEYNGLKTDMEKTEFIKNNIDKFEELGLKIDDINDAEKAFKENNANIIRAFELRARAAAYAAVAAQRYQEAIKAKELAKTTSYKEGEMIPKEWTESDKQYYSGYSKPDKKGNYYFDKQGAEDANRKYLIEAIDAEQKAKDLIQQEADAQAELNALMKEEGLLIDENNNKRNNNKGGTSTKNDHEVGSAAYYDNLIAEQNKKLKEQVHTDEEILAIQKEITKLTQLRDRALGMKLEVIPELKARTGNEPQQIPATIQVEELDFSDVSFEELNQQITKGIGDAISGAQSLNNAVKSVGSSIEDLGNGWDNNKSAIENITSKVGDILSIMQSVISVMETLNTLSQIFNGLSNTQWILEKKKNAEKMTGVAATVAAAGAAQEEAIANTVGAAAAAGESASKIPMVGWVLAIGAIAAILGAIALSKNAVHFAKGGIVPGNSFSGDNISAQLNSGEMVLNTGQQRRLFNLLNGSGSVNDGSGKVEFVIKGQELKGVLNNYDKKMSRI